MSAVAGLITRLAVAWVQFSTRFAALVLAGALLLVGAAGWYASGHLGIDTSTADMIAERLPWRQSFIDYREAFPQLERTLVIVIDGADRDQADLFRDELVSRLQVQSELLQQVYAPGADPFFQREGLLYRDLAQLQQLSGQLVEAQPFIGRLSNDPGSAGLFGLIADALAQPPADRTGVLLQRVAAVTAAVADGQPQALSWQALMLGEDEQPARHVVVATVPEGFAAAASAIRLVRETATAIDVTVEPVTVRLTGPVALEYEELASVASGVQRSAIGAFLMVLLVLSIALRSPWLVLATLVTLIAGLVLTAGFAALAVGRLNLISVAFAVLYIGLGVDFAIHYLMRVREAVAGGVSKIDALSDSAGDVGASLIICAITTSLGFFAFFPTTFRGVAELGLISGVGMYLSLIVTLSLLPAMLRFLPVRVRATGMQVGFLAPLAYSRAFWLWAIVFLMACALTLPWVSFDSDPLNLRDPAAESVSTYRDLMRDPDHAPRALSLLVEADEAARTSRRLERLPQVSEVRGLDDLIASQQQEKLALVDELNWILGAPVAVAESKSDSAQVAAAIARLRPVLATQDLPAAGKLDAALARITPDQYGQLDRALTGTLAYRLRALSAGLQARGFGAADLPSDVSERYLTADGR
ncbi:MAG: MMPL family transporter, partial [Gammaproteobacteria bacterium]|nr:MMPL family transporter [Gammaproteobacteria bacterium]